MFCCSSWIQSQIFTSDLNQMANVVVHCLNAIYLTATCIYDTFFLKCATEYRKRIGPTLYFNIIQSKKNVQKKLEKHCEIYFWVIIQTKLARICGIINPGVLVMKDFTIKKNACIHMHHLCILGLDNKT